MHSDLKKLMDLQELHTTIHKSQKRIDDTPNRLAEIEETRKKADMELANAQHALEEARSTRRKLEGNLSDLEQKLSRFQDQVFQVKKNEEYQALMKETSTAKAEIEGMEDQILEQMEKIEDSQGLVQSTDRACQHARISCEQGKKEAEEDKERLTAEVGKLEIARDRLEEEFDKNLLSMFRRVARGRGGIAMAQVKDETCQLCHVRIRPQPFQDLKMGTGIIQCGSCNRFLYLVEEEKGEVSGAGGSPG